MNRNPSSRELLRAVAGWLAKGEPAGRFEQAVAANAIGIVDREIEHRERVDTEAARRIADLLGTAQRDRPTLETMLVEALRRGEIAPDDPKLLEHLRRTALDDLSIDQPRYVHSLAEPFGHA